MRTKRPRRRHASPPSRGGHAARRRGGGSVAQGVRRASPHGGPAGVGRETGPARARSAGGRDGDRDRPQGGRRHRTPAARARRGQGGARRGERPYRVHARRRPPRRGRRDGMGRRARSSLSRDTVLRLEGFGTVALAPGGGVDALATAAADAERAFDAALAAVGVASLDEARIALSRKLEAEREAEGCDRLVAADAPKGSRSCGRRWRRSARRSPARARAGRRPTQRRGATTRFARGQAAADSSAAAAGRARDSRDAREHAARHVLVADERLRLAKAEANTRRGRPRGGARAGRRRHLAGRARERGRRVRRRRGRRRPGP